jgi:hypothetical protein
MKEKLTFDKPICPPRLPGFPKPKPCPTDFTPVLRMDVKQTATKYGVSKETIWKWRKEWMDRRPFDRRFDLQQEGTKP